MTSMLAFSGRFGVKILHSFFIMTYIKRLSVLNSSYISDSKAIDLYKDKLELMTEFT